MPNTPISVEAEVKQYTLVGDDIYVKRYTNENIPTWYSDMVSTIIAADPTVTDQSGAIAYLESLSPGYNLSITNLQAEDLRIDTVQQGLVTTTGDHTAAISNLDITKTDAASSAAIALDTVGAYFADGSAAAFFDSQISTYASNIASNASSLSTLSSSLNGVTARVDTIDYVSVDVNGYSLGSSKLGTAPDGSITGWQFVDGTGIQSEFKIQADKFSIQGSTLGYTPFAIDTLTDKIKFTGDVRFEGLGIDGGSTTINGDKITTDSVKTLQLDATEIKAGSMFVDNTIMSTGFVPGPTGAIATGTTPTGFRLDARSTSGSSTLPSIYGAYIRGSTIESSTMKIKDLVFLTDADYETSAIISSDSAITGTSTKLLDYDIQTYNSTTGTNRIARPRPRLQFMGQSYVNERYINTTYKGWTAVGAGSDTDRYSLKVEVKRGATSLGSYTHTATSYYGDSTVQQVGGFTIAFIGSVWIDSDLDDDRFSVSVYMPPVQTLSADLAGDGSISITISSPSPYDVYGYSNTLVCYNI